MAAHDTSYQSPNSHRLGSSSMATSSRSDDPASPNPASSLLHGMLREKKEENRRHGRTSDMHSRNVSSASHAFDDRNVQSSPIAPPSRGNGESAHTRQTSRALNGRDPRAMGMREMEESISKLDKLNFDLKLEIFKQRQRNDSLEEKLARMQEVEDNNREMQSINEDLVKELELRDAAVKEAVDLICELEAKAEDMEVADYTIATLTRNSCSPQTLPSSPPQPDERTLSNTAPTKQLTDGRPSNVSRQGATAYPDRAVSPPAKVARRPPSFLREDKPSTSALRSLYRSDTHASLLSLNRAGSPQRELDPDTFTLNSPRLSVLSESSFLSVYGKSPRLSLGPAQDLDIPRTRTPVDTQAPQRPKLRSARRSSDATSRYSRDRVHQSVSEQSSAREAEQRSDKSFLSRVEQMTKSQSRSSSQNRDEHLSRWLDESISGDERSPLRHRSHRQRPAKPRRSSAQPASNEQYSSIGEVLHKPLPQELEAIPALPALTKPNITGPQVLPPTPDTMSTAQKASSSTQSIIAEKSLNDIPHHPKKYSSALPNTKSYKLGSLGLEFESDVDASDDEEQQSVRVHQSEADSTAVPSDAFDSSFPFFGPGTPSKPRRMLGYSPPTRPSLATNPQPDSKDYETSTKASRALSYPSPKSDGRRSSIVTTPTRPEPSRGVTTHAPLSPKEWMGNGPKKPLASHSSQHSSQAQKTSIASSHESPEPLSESKIPKTTSSRLKTLFRRSNSQSSATVLGLGSSGGVERERGSKIARPGTAGGGGSGGGLGRSASGKVFGGRRG